MCVFNYQPILFRACFLVPTNPVPFQPPVDPFSYIYFILGDLADRSAYPNRILIFIGSCNPPQKPQFSRAGYAFRIECPRNGIETITLCPHPKDAVDDWRRFRIDIICHTLRVSQIPVGYASIGGQELSCMHFGRDTGAYFHRNILCIRIIHNHFERQHQGGSVGLLVQAVIIVVNANQPDAHFRQRPFHQFACKNEMSTQAGNILHNNAVYLIILQVRHHTYIVRPVIVHARVTIICIGLYDFYILFPFQIILHDLFLISQRVLFFVVSIFLRQSAIQSCAITRNVCTNRLWQNSVSAFSCHLYYLLRCLSQQSLIRRKFIPKIEINTDFLVRVNIYLIYQRHDCLTSKRLQRIKPDKLHDP